MTSPSKTNASPVRGEVWWIQFDPSVGSEQRKTRPAVVLNVGSVGKLLACPPKPDPPTMRVPRATVPWLVYLKATSRNGLTKDSAADAFQVKSLSLQRFVKKMGVLTADEMEQIAAAIALCVGAP